MKITIDAKKFKYDFKFARQCGKTNMQLEILKAYMESLNTGKPVEIEFGFREIDVSHLI